jgi:hypothetical protein
MKTTSYYCRRRRRTAPRVQVKTQLIQSRHGGGFIRGDKRDRENVGQQFIREGSAGAVLISGVYNVHMEKPRLSPLRQIQNPVGPRVRGQQFGGETVAKAREEHRWYRNPQGDCSPRGSMKPVPSPQVPSVYSSSSTA